MRGFLQVAAAVIVAVFVAVPSVVSGGASKLDANLSQPSTFDVSLGKTVHAFTFASTGQLLYRDKPFAPPIKVRTDSIRKISISLVTGRNLAVAIGRDQDGQDPLFLLKLNVGVSIPFQRGWVKWVAPSRVFWSPSGKYLLALCAYEGQRFLRADIKSGEVVDGPWLAPGDKSRIWTISDEPSWQDRTDILVFAVKETCNPFEGACGANAESAEKVLARHSVLLDAETLALRVTP